MAAVQLLILLALPSISHKLEGNLAQTFNHGSKRTCKDKTPRKKGGPCPAMPVPCLSGTFISGLTSVPAA